MKNNNVEKELPAKGDLSEREELIKLASETAAEEKDFQEAVIRIPLEGGGSAKIIKFSDYKDPAKKVKDIDLASLFTPGKTLASLSSDEREKVNMLLRLTLGKKD